MPAPIENTLSEAITPEPTESTVLDVANLAQAAVAVHRLTDGELYAVRNDDGTVEMVETPEYSDSRDAAPSRLHRRTLVHDRDSLIEHIARNVLEEDGELTGDYLHGAGILEVWADIDASTITAILDGQYGWHDDVAVLTLRKSREWQEWASIDGKLLDQVQFAEFIEDHLSTIAEPAGADLMEICQTLTVNVGAKFRQQNILASGQRQFRYEEEVEGKAGKRGELAIPGELQLVLRPYDGAEPVAMTARFRFRADAGELRLGVKLTEPATVLEQAFTQIIDELNRALPVAITRGSTSLL